MDDDAFHGRDRRGCRGEAGCEVSPGEGRGGDLGRWSGAEGCSGEGAGHQIRAGRKGGEGVGAGGAAVQPPSPGPYPGTDDAGGKRADTPGGRGGFRRHLDRDWSGPPIPRQRRGRLSSRYEKKDSDLLSARRRGPLYGGGGEIPGTLRSRCGLSRLEPTQGEGSTSVPGENRPRLSRLLEVGAPSALGRQEGVLLLDRQAEEEHTRCRRKR